MHRYPASTRRIDQLLSAASLADRDDLSRRMAALAYERGLWKESQGRKLRLSLALRPWVLSVEERRRVHALAWQLRMALRRLCFMTDAQPEFAQVVPLDPREVAWIQRYRRADLERRRGERVFCRLDALLQRSEGTALHVRWLEPNVVGIGGLSYSAAIEAATSEVLLPWLHERDPSLALERGDDGPRLLLAELYEHAAQLGVSGPPVVALVDDFTEYPLGGELARLRDFFATQGVQAVLTAPEALEAASEGRLIAAGLEVDLVYRFLELPELIAIEESGKNLSGMHRAFEQGRVVPSIGGDLEHKSVLETFSRADLLADFPREQCDALSGSVLWTRLLRERRTNDPDGRPCELGSFTEQQRERLVLKPNRGYGGQGVVIGPAVDQRTWSGAVSAALSQPDRFVVQEHAAADLQELTVVNPDGVYSGPHHLSAAVFPSREGVCLFGRFSSGSVVNIQQGGGVIAFMLEQP